MEFIEQLLLGLALAMDAFAISICLGLSSQDKNKKALEAGLWFGGAQALMALIGFFLGQSFRVYIESVDHWVAFFLLVFIGASMIKESIESRKMGESCVRKSQSMFLLAIATSIDALAVGISISIVTHSFLSPIIVIGVISFILSIVGVLAGNSIGARRKFIAEIAGGSILILIGVKILLEGFIG